jgi:hypothetical protein
MDLDFHLHSLPMLFLGKQIFFLILFSVEMHKDSGRCWPYHYAILLVYFILLIVANCLVQVVCKPFHPIQRTYFRVINCCH